MNFKDWLKDSDKEIQEVIDSNIDATFDRQRVKIILPYYINYKVLQEQKKLIYQTRVLTMATWVLAIITIVLAIITWLKP